MRANHVPPHVGGELVAARASIMSLVLRAAALANEALAAVRERFRRCRSERFGWLCRRQVGRRPRVAIARPLPPRTRGTQTSVGEGIANAHRHQQGLFSQEKVSLSGG